MTAKAKSPFNKRFHTFARACVEHADDLLGSARAVQAAGHSNIAYHLAALALEEIGKRELLGVCTVASQRDVPPAWPQKHMQDHVQKLFWSFFTVAFGKERLTTANLDSMRGLASRVHQTRIAGLYVSGDQDGVSMPSRMVSPKEADNLIAMAHARIDLAKATPARRVGKEDLELQQWFLQISDDEEWRRLIFSKKSMDKLAELGGARAWVAWLKEVHDKQETENRALMEAELARSRERALGVGKDKWRLKIRLFSDSHSIRPKALNAWNQRVTWIKLVPVPEKKNELLIEVTLRDNVHVDGLWWISWGIARHFVVALNIGTMGFFWWYRPRQVDRFYERLDDLEHKAEIRLERSPSLKVDWGENRTLSEEDLTRAAQCFTALPAPHARDQHEPFNYYVGGLTFLSINDIHWQCEANVFGNFYKSLQEMMAASGDWKKGKPFDEPFGKFLAGTWPELEEREQYLALGRTIDSQQQRDIKVTLKEASFMKLFCDAYFMMKTRERLHSRSLMRKGH